MNIYFAGTGPHKYLKPHLKDVYMLESYYYFERWQEEFISSDFMLDSGAFTFMNSARGKKVDWDKYIEGYAKFIVKHNVKLFFELDIDVIVGIKEVERLRNKLEKLTKRKCIPVWHKSRGKEYFLRMVKTYDYVAIGGIVTKEIRRSEYKHFKWFIDTAHAHNCKIHGLGFTNIKYLKQLNFDSVDSTSWLGGSRFGLLYQYQYQARNLIYHKRPGRIKMHYKELETRNLLEWKKFAKYAKRYL